MDHVDTSSSLLRRHEIRDFLKTAISLNIQAESSKTDKREEPEESKPF